MHKKTLIKISLVSIAALMLSQALMTTANAQWDFPRLDEIFFRIRWPYTVSLEAAKACEIDTYVGAIRLLEVNTLTEPEYNWTVTAAPGFHMCYIGINCRDVTPETSGERFDHHGRTPGFELYPLNLSAFRYALELIVGCNKTVWINDIYGYINVRLDTNVPPANVFWYNPSIMPYPLDWDEAYNQLIAAGFSGTIGENDWLMPNGQLLRTFYIMSPQGTATSEEITRRHVSAWNAFFCGQWIADPPHDCEFIHEPTDFYQMIDIAFYDRDHDMYMLCWGLGRNPDYLWDFFHPDADIPDGNNSPGLNWRPLNAMIHSLRYSRYDEKVELRVFGPGPLIVSQSTEYYTEYLSEPETEDLWIGTYCGNKDYPYYVRKLERDTDYEILMNGTYGGGVRFLEDESLGPDEYIHLVYTLSQWKSINARSELQSLCYAIQDMLYYMCPYLPIYSRNYHDLYKPGLECWVPSLGYGSAAYQLKWTYGSLHWTGTPVGGSIQWHLPGPVNTLHPWLATSVYETTVLNRLYDGMIEINAYTHQDILWLANRYKIEDWTGPSGEPGMKITWWIRNDIKWQDGDPITADDFVWQYDFINSIQPSQLYNVWSTYHGCEKHNDYCFSIYVNTTGIWTFYYYTGGPAYPRKVWLPYYGDKASAETFRPWQVPHPNGTLPTSLYGTGEWVFHYYDETLGLVRVYKNPSWWARLVAMPCKQIPSVYTMTEANAGNRPKVAKSVVGLYTFNLDTKENCAHTWALKIDGKTHANGSRTLSPLEHVSWYEMIPWETLTSGLHIFSLETTNVYGRNVYTIILYVLIGDINDDGIVNMLDLFKTAKRYGETGEPCWTPEDVDNDGVITMLDIFIIGKRFGTT